MKVFISWSGERSQQTALVLREWLPQVLQSVVPWMSTEDIDKGARSTTEIKRALADASFGVVCVTRENARAPWLNFEAGALSKEVADSRNYVAPFLLDMEPEDITGPLVDFQVTKFNETDVRRMVGNINALLPSPLSDSRFDTAFRMWWPTLSEQLTAVMNATDDVEVKPRSTEDMLGEILTTLRSQRRQVTYQGLPKNGSPSVRSDTAVVRDRVTKQRLVSDYVKDCLASDGISPWMMGWPGNDLLRVTTETPLSDFAQLEIDHYAAQHGCTVAFDANPWLGQELHDKED